MATSTIFSWLRSKILQSSCRFLGDFGILNKIGVPGTEKYGFQAEGAGQDFSFGPSQRTRPELEVLIALSKPCIPELSSETRKRGPHGLASSAPTEVSGTWSWLKE